MKLNLNIFVNERFYKEKFIFNKNLKNILKDVTKNINKTF